MSNAVLIVAGGVGSRAAGAGETPPKQYRLLAGRSVLERAITPFLDHPDISAVQVAIHRDHAAAYAEATANLKDRLLPPVLGGDTRQRTVLIGLEAMAAAPPKNILIHDAARPFVGKALIDQILSAVATGVGAIAAVPVADTIKKADADGNIQTTIDRTDLWQAQTPQAFPYPLILNAHRKAAAAGRSDFTDDAALAEWTGLAVRLVPSSRRNIKLTTSEDLALANRIMAKPTPLPDIRTATGYDVHRFTEGDHLWLCGHKIPHNQALAGHSDADVALHALTDALLGAIADGDIGVHFPPSDPQWKGAPSRTFLDDARKRIEALGGVITNIDVTIICEAPKIGGHRDAMRRSLADLLSLDIARVSVKATTTEGLGFTGRREGIAALATATVALSTTPT